jgi:RNA polymerase sigma-70 factor (ECF subfamily)
MPDWNQIYDEFGPVVWKQTLRMLGNSTDAADCFQEVMLEAFKTNQRQTIRSWPGFLKRLAVLRSLDFLRARYRHATDPLPREEIPTTENPQTRSSSRYEGLAERLRLALTQLPAAQAEAFSLKCIEELSTEEVAQRMELSANHVGVLVHRARVALRKLLADRDGN